MPGSALLFSVGPPGSGSAELGGGLGDKGSQNGVSTYELGLARGDANEFVQRHLEGDTGTGASTKRRDGARLGRECESEICFRCHRGAASSPLWPSHPTHIGAWQHPGPG